MNINWKEYDVRVANRCLLHWFWWEKLQITIHVQVYCFDITVNKGLMLPSHLLSMGFGQDKHILNILLQHYMFVLLQVEECFDRTNKEYSL